MINLAKRTTRIDSSGIRKVFALAADMKDPVNLSIGQPHFDVPDAIKETAIDSIRSGKNSYTLTAGLPAFREKIKQSYLRRGLDLGDVMITSGVSGGILLSLMATLDEGDEIIIPDPYFVMYMHLTNFIAAKPVYMDTYPDFQIDPEKLKRLITPKTKAILLNSPCNPTGVVLSVDTLKAVCEVAEKHGILIISDEIYEAFLYDETQLRSPAEFYPYTLILNGFSKSSAMTGWRLGYAYGPKEIIAAMINIQMYSFVCAPSFAQYAGMEAMEYDMSSYRADYKQKRDRIYNGIQSRFQVAKPGGAFYIFPESPTGNGDEFVKKAIENNLLIVPGSVFSQRNTHFRISFAADDQTIDRGIEILNRLADQ